MTLAGRIRNSFLAGALLVAPLTVTVLVLQFVFVRATRALNPLVRATRLATYTGDLLLAQLLAAALVATGVTLVGYAASWSLGRRLFGSLERGVRLVPLVRTVYFGVRQVSESLLERAAGYESVVLVEYPREGLYSVGFVTGRAPRTVRRAADEDLSVVFTPNSPNPTGGRLVLVAPDDLYDLDVSVRRGLRLLITTGLTVDAVEDELAETVGRLPDDPEADPSTAGPEDDAGSAVGTADPDTDTDTDTDAGIGC